MPLLLTSAEHVFEAEQFEAFLKIITTSAAQHRGWRVTVWFYIALHYVEAFLVTKSRRRRDHLERAEAMEHHPETRAIENAYHRLYKFSREARYEGTPFTDDDLRHIEPLYLSVRQAMRSALGLSP